MREYWDLEQAVLRLVGPLCSSPCALCEDRCCKLEICQESLESPWLAAIRLLSGQGEPQWDEAQGWLGRGGCLLEAGRPPVCLGYFCAPALAGLDEDRQYALLVAGALVDYLGRRALGQQHLVELMDAAQINRLRPARLLQRLGSTRELLQICQRVLDGAPLNWSTRRSMVRVRAPSSS